MDFIIFIIIIIVLFIGLPAAAVGLPVYALALDLGAQSPAAWGYGGGAFGAVIAIAWIGGQR